MRIQSFGLVVVVSLALALAFAVSSSSASLAGEEPSAADFIKQLPSIQSTDPGIRSIEMVGSMKNGFHLRFRALYRAPDHYSLLVSDGSDGTPLVYVADRQLLCYDPIRSSVLCLKGCSARLSFESDGPFANFLFGFLPDGKQGHGQNSLNIDVKSVAERLFVADRVVKFGEAQYRLFLKKERYTMVCAFDTTRARPFESLKVFDDASHESFVSIDKLVIDGPALADEEFRFPDRDRLARKLPVHELVGGGFVTPEVEIAKITTAMMARLGATHPGLRETLKEPAFRQLDWNAIQHRDRKVAGLLRELVPGDRRPNPGSEVKKPSTVPLIGTGGSTRR